MATIAEVAAAALLAKQAAEAAERAEQEQLLSEMTQGLLEAFLGEPVDLQPSHLDLANELAVYRDPAGLCLSVTSAGQVRLVEEAGPGQWTPVGGPYATLAELGADLAEQQPGLDVPGQG